MDSKGYKVVGRVVFNDEWTSRGGRTMKRTAKRVVSVTGTPFGMITGTCRHQGKKVMVLKAEGVGGDWFCVDGKCPLFPIEKKTHK